MLYKRFVKCSLNMQLLKNMRDGKINCHENMPVYYWVTFTSTHSFTNVSLWHDRQFQLQSDQERQDQPSINTLHAV